MRHLLTYLNNYVIISHETMALSMYLLSRTYDHIAAKRNTPVFRCYVYANMATTRKKQRPRLLRPPHHYTLTTFS